MTYQELKTIILRMAKGGEAGGDQLLSMGMLHELVMNARAFVLMKMTSNGRNLESSVIQRLENVVLRPLPVATTTYQVNPEQFLPANGAINSENALKYYSKMYYADLPSELLHFSNIRALRAVTSIDYAVSCAIIEQESVRTQDDELFPNVIRFAWVNRKRLYVRDLSENSLGLTVKFNSTGLPVSDTEPYPTGTSLLFRDSTDTQQPMYLKAVNVSGVFRDPVAAGGHTGAGGNEDLSSTEVNCPAEYLDLLIDQVFTSYTAKAVKTPPENILQGKRDEKQDLPLD